MTGQQTEKLEHIVLSEQYYKSRKQLMLYSGLFFIYEFIGVKIPTKPFPNNEIELLTPQAVPVVLLVLILYFMYRTILGWYQSDRNTRKFKVSKFDFTPSLIIATLPILLFSYQAITKTQFASILVDSSYKALFSLILGICFSLCWYWVTWQINHRHVVHVKGGFIKSVFMTTKSSIIPILINSTIITSIPFLIGKDMISLVYFLIMPIILFGIWLGSKVIKTPFFDRFKALIIK